MEPRTDLKPERSVTSTSGYHFRLPDFYDPARYAPRLGMGNCLRGGNSQSEDYSLLHSQLDSNDRQQMGNTQAVPTSNPASRSSGGAGLSNSEAILINPEFPTPSPEESVHVQGSVETGERSSSEVDQMKLAQRYGLIQHLPSGLYDGGKKDRECPICMVELNAGDPVRFLPCMHVYHKDCIDDWLLKHSLTCPNCMEPVDSALLNSYEVGKTPWNFNS